MECEAARRRNFTTRAQAKIECFDFERSVYNTRHWHSAHGMLSPAAKNNDKTQAPDHLSIAA